MQHHDEAATRFVARTRGRPGVRAVLLTGSVATGRERPDSDVDLVLVVDDEQWDAALAAGRIMYTETDGIGYEHGYFDVKLATPEILAAAAERGDDPVRDSLAEAKVLFTEGFDAQGVIRRLAERPDGEWLELATSFLAQARLHGEYFLLQGLERGDPLLTAHAAVHLATSAARAALALHHVRFPGPKHLIETLEQVPGLPDGLRAAVLDVVTAPSTTTGGALLAHLEGLAGGALDGDAALSRFVLDNELAWFTRVPPPEYR